MVIAHYLLGRIFFCLRSAGRHPQGGIYKKEVGFGAYALLVFNPVNKTGGWCSIIHGPCNSDLIWPNLHFRMWRFCSLFKPKKKWFRDWQLCRMVCSMLRKKLNTYSTLLGPIENHDHRSGTGINFQQFHRHIHQDSTVTGVIKKKNSSTATMACYRSL